MLFANNHKAKIYKCKKTLQWHTIETTAAVKINSKRILFYKLWTELLPNRICTYFHLFSWFFKFCLTNSE
jgi:hypothetical protein